MAPRLIRKTGPGKARNYKSLPAVPAVLGSLYNFDINGHDLKDQHKEWLDKYVLPVLTNGGSLTIRGLTSTKGDPDLQSRIVQRSHVLRSRLPDAQHSKR